MDYRQMSQSLSRYAVEAMLYEVTAAPKPGLVDRQDASDNCSLHTFEHLDSSEETGHASLFGNLRRLGIQAERDMLHATKGINTHKGMIFSLGILVSATSIIWHRNGAASSEIDDILGEVKKLTEGLCSTDFAFAHKKKNPTAGERLFLDHGITGIRGEAEAGYPTIRNIGYPCFKMLMEQGELSINDAMVHVLFHIMAETTDTNILARTDIQTLDYVKGVARSYINTGGIHHDRDYRKIAAINEAFIEMNISPGGSADLLAATVFMYLIESKGV